LAADGLNGTDDRAQPAGHQMICASAPIQEAGKRPDFVEEKWQL
jgi:hypothetical protein